MDSDLEMKCPFAVKVQWARDGDATNEAKVATLMGEQGIGPRVYDSWICDKTLNYADLWIAQPKPEFCHPVSSSKRTVSFIVMDRLQNGMTLKKYVQEEEDGKFPEALYCAIEQKAYEMYKLGYIHLDLHWNNVYLTSPHPPFKIMLLDFKSTLKTESDSLITFYLQFMHRILTTWQVHNTTNAIPKCSMFNRILKDIQHLL